MGSPHDLSGFAPPDASGSGLSGETPCALRGRIVAAPAARTSVLSVASVASGERWDVVSDQWAKGASLPAQDARCLIVIDDSGDAWVPLWAGMS